MLSIRRFRISAAKVGPNRCHQKRTVSWLTSTPRSSKVREGGRVISRAVIIAVAVNDDGKREVLGVATGPSEAETFWTDFLRSLADRGLRGRRGVKLVIADDHKGLRAAVRRVFNASHQRCRIHWMRNALPLRQTAGMMASLLKLAGLDWPVPDFSTLCRRQKTLAVQVPYRRAFGPLNLLVDSTGIKFLGDGEWQARKHGVQGRRQWRKVHLAMDPATSDIRAVEFTPSRDGDSPVLPDLLGQIPEDEQIGTVTADGAYDTRRCHKAITDRQGTAIIPIRTNGRLWKEDCPAARARNDTLRATRYYGRAFWKRWTGYHARSRIEARMRCLKSFGERIMARDPDRQTAEIHIRIALMNRFNAFGTAEIVRAA